MEQPAHFFILRAGKCMKSLMKIAFRGKKYYSGNEIAIFGTDLTREQFNHGRNQH